MPWEAPFVKVGKGASSGDAVDGSGEETGQGRAGNLVGKVLQQSLQKVPVKELEKTKPGKPVVKRFQSTNQELRVQFSAKILFK